MTGWVHGSFGSCSGCDAFEFEFESSYLHSTEEEDHDTLYDEVVEGCEACAGVLKRLILFGKGYLGHIMTQEEAKRIASENLEWDVDSEKMVEFIRTHSIEIPESQL